MDWNDRIAFLENVHLSAVRVPCGGNGGTPRGAKSSRAARDPGRSLESARQAAEAVGAGFVCQRRCQRFGGRIRRNRSERTLPKSLTTRARVAALRLIGQPASRGSPRGRTHRGPKTSGAGSAWTESRFRLDPPGPGKSARLCRARGAGLSSGRSRSREGNPRGVDAVPSIACRRRVSIRVLSGRRAA